MKILKEAKENLPIAFLTDFISKGWEEVGYLKADIEAIKETYKGTKNIEELIQNLIDAYLVCIGQLEAHLQDKNYIEYPEESGLLKEDFDIKVKDDSIEIVSEENLAVEKQDDKVIITELEDKEDKVKVATEEGKDEDSFEYFVDFDEPDMSEPRITDKELYGEE